MLGGIDKLCPLAYSSGMRTTTELIKVLRAAGLSQSEIARRSGIPQPRVSRWEAGATPDSADDALRLQTLVAQVEEAPGVGPIDRDSPDEVPLSEGVRKVDLTKTYPDGLQTERNDRMEVVTHPKVA